MSATPPPAIPTATDVIPAMAEMGERMKRLPMWAHEKAAEILYPDCPPPGVLYIMSAPRKVFLGLTIAEALVEASERGSTVTEGGE